MVLLLAMLIAGLLVLDGCKKKETPVPPAPPKTEVNVPAPTTAPAAKPAPAPAPVAPNAPTSTNTPASPAK